MGRPHRLAYAARAKGGVMSAKGWRRLAVVVAVPAAILVAYVYGALWMTYSQGERAGILQNVRRTGRFCKTWEGELAMTSVPGVMPVIWHFSVRNQAAIPQLNGALGKNVTLRYDQHRYLPTSCFGETDTFVEAVVVHDRDQAAAQ
jgi:hypothetical protein